MSETLNIERAQAMADAWTKGTTREYRGEVTTMCWYLHDAIAELARLRAEVERLVGDNAKAILCGICGKPRTLHPSGKVYECKAQYECEIALRRNLASMTARAEAAEGIVSKLRSGQAV